jgi:hypothetical protein
MAQMALGALGIVLIGLVIFHNKAHDVNDLTVWVMALVPIAVVAHPIASVLFPNAYARRFAVFSHVVCGIGSVALSAGLIAIAAGCEKYAVCVSGAECDGVIPLGASGFDPKFVAVLVLDLISLIPQCLVLFILYMTKKP